MIIFKQSVIIAAIILALSIPYSKIQNKNNFKRCVSVVSAAIATGKFPKDPSAESRCKYHLNKDMKVISTLNGEEYSKNSGGK